VTVKSLAKIAMKDFTTKPKAYGALRTFMQNNHLKDKRPRKPVELNY
jgi:hypothetical protein